MPGGGFGVAFGTFDESLDELCAYAPALEFTSWGCAALWLPNLDTPGSITGGMHCCTTTAQPAGRIIRIKTNFESLEPKR
mmetsp:Transcript_77529/g.215428  ORF Transcript_77529/g.215428 Transcript_77529/m.215428 type:complete len:80 (-) Transcript_77529:28-267(-)